MDFKNQHIVTAGYLKEWCDPRTPPGHTPYVWLVSKDGQLVVKKAPKNIFSEKDFYTVFDENGNRNLELEHYLHKIEDNFLAARRAITNKHPINNFEFQSIILFIASTYARSDLQKREQKEIWSSLLNIYQSSGIEQSRPDILTQIENLKIQPLPFHIFNFLNISVPYLLKMKLKIFVTSGETRFITSDNPVLWIDPSIWLTSKPNSFFGLESPSLEILFPISPNYLAQLSWNEPEQYQFLDPESNLVNEINGMVVYWSDKFIVMDNNVPNPYWFEKN